MRCLCNGLVVSTVVVLLLSAWKLPMARGQDLDTVLGALETTIGNVSDLSTLSVQGSGQVWVNFEAETPEEVTKASEFDFDYSFDLDKDFIRIDLDFTPFFEVFQFFPGTNNTRIVQGNVGAIFTPLLFTSNGTLPSQSVGAIRRNQMLLHPHILLRSALLSSSEEQGTVTAVSYDGTTKDGMEVLKLSNDPVSEILVHVDVTTGTVAKIVTMESNPLVRDVPVEVVYSDWSSTDAEGGGISYPAMVEIFTLDSKTKIWEERRSGVQVDVTFPDDHFDLPATIDMNVEEDALLYGMQSHHVVEPFFHLGFPWPYDSPYGEQIVLAPGVFLYPSGFANALIIRSEETDEIVVVEASGNEFVGQRLVDLVNEVSGRNNDNTDVVTHVIQTHHHVDHASGIRTVVGSTEANLVVGSGVKEFWEATLAAPSTIRPDVLTEKQSSSFIPTVVEVPEIGSLGIMATTTHEVSVLHTDADPHARDAVIIIVKTDGKIFVFMSDFYNAGFGLTVVVGGPQGLFTALMQHGILDCVCDSVSGEPVNIVPGHGVVKSLEDSIIELDGLDVPTGCQPATCKDEADDGSNMPNGDGAESGTTSRAFALAHNMLHIAGITMLVVSHTFSN